MSRHVNHISDIPQTRKFDMDAGLGYSASKTFTQYKKAWGTGAKRRMKQVGKRLKEKGLISNYRRASYRPLKPEGTKLTCLDNYSTR